MKFSIKDFFRKCEQIRRKLGYIEPFYQSFTCSNSTMETPQKCVESAQS